MGRRAARPLSEEAEQDLSPFRIVEHIGLEKVLDLSFQQGGIVGPEHPTVLPTLQDLLGGEPVEEGGDCGRGEARGGEASGDRLARNRGTRETDSTEDLPLRGGEEKALGQGGVRHKAVIEGGVVSLLVLSGGRTRRAGKRGSRGAGEVLEQISQVLQGNGRFRPLLTENPDVVTFEDEQAVTRSKG
ncbi:MAG TPA: hypothetical protein VGH73_17835 [Thermoanaerobaculia bacterium]|jgi:hypothetical protein